MQYLCLVHGDDAEFATLSCSRPRRRSTRHPWQPTRSSGEPAT